MGYGKYTEDNIEINNDRLYMNSEWKISYVNKGFLYKKCPFCNKAIKEKELKLHIRDIHKNEGILICNERKIESNSNNKYNHIYKLFLMCTVQF